MALMVSCASCFAAAASLCTSCLRCLRFLAVPMLPGGHAATPEVLEQPLSRALQLAQKTVVEGFRCFMAAARALWRASKLWTLGHWAV